MSQGERALIMNLITEGVDERGTGSYQDEK